MKKIVVNLVFLSFALLLSACATQPQTSLSLTSVKYLNPDINGNPSPLVVTFYDLKSPFKFKQASYSQLENNASATLGGNLIDKNTVEIRPGSQKEVTQPLSPNTQYVGIVAAYRNIDNANWQSLIKVPSGAKNISIKVMLESQGLVASVSKGNWLFS